MTGSNEPSARQDLLPDRKYAYRDLGDVLVLGLGVSGKAASEYIAGLLGGRARTLSILGGAPTEESLAWAEVFQEAHSGKDITIAFEEQDASKVLPEGARAFDMCVASPGISAFSDMCQSAKDASQEVISEVELAWRESPEGSRWAAITGTNGKTTTTALLNHVLKAAGLNSRAVGNIGESCMTQVSKDLASGLSGDDSPVYVVETSSYQLASVSHFAPNVAVILGITPDHIKWHKSHEHYAASKFKLLDNLARVPGSVAVLDAVNDEVREKVKELKAMPVAERGFAYVPLGTRAGIQGDMREACGADDAAFIDPQGHLLVALNGQEADLCDAADLSILGRHNQLNALAASTAALALGVDGAKVGEALTTFKPLEHRIEPAGQVRGISYYNDSKATNVDATLVALEAFLPIRPIVMLGGDDKGTDLAPLVDSCSRNAKACICYGEARERFHDALGPLEDEGVAVIRAGSFDDAFDAASSMAEDGDIVLLSPACASFDEFSCFEERGRRFKERVRAL